MKPNDLQRMYGSTPVSFQNRVADTLARARIQEAASSARSRRTLRTALVIALALALTASLAAAAFSTRTADLFGWFYGEGTREKLLNGSTASTDQSARVGDVIYTLEEVTRTDDGLYAVVTLTPADDSVVLMAEDYRTEDAAGYGLWYGPESEAPENAESYAELARRRGAAILVPTISPEAIGIGGSMTELESYGYSYLPQPDGSIRFMVEIPSENAVEPGETYDIRFWLASWMVTPEGEHLRGVGNDTYAGEQWTVSVCLLPAAAEEGARP